ncbi:MAG: hypothetical protein ABJE95_06895 [Byssovorax sp.]
MVDSAGADGPAARVEKTEKAEKKGRSSWRGYNRAIHRDLGHVAVGLTLIYAISGLAVNHILDWDPSFVAYSEVHELGAPLSGTDDEAAASAMKQLGVAGTPRDVYREGPTDLQVVLDKRTLHVNTESGHVVDEGQRPRFFLRVVNWLHLSRGKKAWTVIADTYAVGLIFLAISGILMSPGRKGLFGRGGLFMLVGIAVPIVYVQLSGGPEAQSGKPGAAAPAASAR